MSITRRNLVQAGGMAAIAALAANTAIAEEAPAEEESVDMSAMAGMMGGGASVEYEPRTVPWADAEPQIDDSQVEEEFECEVVIAGAGLAGCTATLAAAQAGAASIVVFDKTEAGHSCTGFQTAVINGVQENWGRAGIYDVAEICNHEINECCGWPKHAIWFKWANGIGDTFDWCLDTLGDVYIAKDSADDTSAYDNYVTPLAYPLPDNFDPENEYNTTFATSVSWSTSNFCNKAIELAGELCDFQDFGGHRVEKLIMEDGRCVGCYAYNYETGMYKKVRATKGVVLSMGDYTSDPVLYQYYLPTQYDHNIQLMYGTSDPEGNRANTGEHIKMATWIGARIDENHATNGHHMGQGLSGAGMGAMGIAPFLRLNKDGKRFMNEDQPGQQTENQIELQPGYCAYMFWDASWGEQVGNFPPTHGSVFNFIAEGEDNPNGEGKSQADLDASVESGDAWKADTIDELLAMIDEVNGIDVETAKAQIERYNELARAGYDSDFGKPASRLFPIENPPFYATGMGRATLLGAVTGLESDEECHTFTEDRKVIPGLYVAGNSQGNRFNFQYPIAMEGVATSMCIFYGKVAGENVVNGI